MKYVLAIFLLFPFSRIAFAQCGVERTAVKTLSDPLAAEINFNSIITHVSIQHDMPIDSCWQRFGGRLQSETNLYRIKGYIQGIKRERNDGDYHIIISDDKEGLQTMVLEIPNPLCDSAISSGHNYEYAKCRAWADTAIRKEMNRKVTEKYLITTPIAIDIEGVGYWDRAHDSRGGAPNGRELHPVLLIH